MNVGMIVRDAVIQVEEITCGNVSTIVLGKQVILDIQVRKQAAITKIHSEEMVKQIGVPEVTTLKMNILRITA